MLNLQTTDIIKAQVCCYLQDRESCEYCKQCPLAEIEAGKNCQQELARLTVEKFQELIQLLDDKVNHHYYETLEFYQEDNIRLTNRLNMIGEILDGSKD